MFKTRTLAYLTLIFLVASFVFTDAFSKDNLLRVGQINIFGNKRIKSYIIERELPFKQGDYLDRNKINLARERISEIPGVDFSQVRVGYVPNDSTVAVTVIITEKRTFHGHLLLGRGFENRVSIGLRVREQNFRGRSEKLFASALFRGNIVLEAGWENPWIGGSTHTGLGIRGFYKNYKYVFDDIGQSFYGAKIERVGARISIFHALGKYNKIFLKGEFETVRSPVTGITIKKDRDSYFSVAISLERDSRKSKAFPWDASLFSAGIQAVGPATKDYSILESSVDACKYVSLFSRTALALQGVYRARSGDTVPAYRREHIGGSRTLRAYDYGSFSGVNLLMGTIEYRIPLNFSKNEPVEDVLIGISLHLFSEAAAVWEKNEDLVSDMFHGSFGTGISLVTKNATGIRFDYAWHEHSSGRWELDAGLKF